MNAESFAALAKINRLTARLHNNGVTLKIEGDYWREIAILAARAAEAIEAQITASPDAARAVIKFPQRCCG